MAFLSMSSWNDHVSSSLSVSPWHQYRHAFSKSAQLLPVLLWLLLNLLNSSSISGSSSLNGSSSSSLQVGHVVVLLSPDPHKTFCEDISPDLLGRSSSSSVSMSCQTPRCASSATRGTSSCLRKSALMWSASSSFKKSATVYRSSHCRRVFRLKRQRSGYPDTLHCYRETTRDRRRRVCSGAHPSYDLCLERSVELGLCLAHYVVVDQKKRPRTPKSHACGKFWPRLVPRRSCTHPVGTRSKNVPRALR